ncbi:MAG: type II secretion system protein GspJ [Paracoccaceae bacterium]
MTRKGDAGFTLIEVLVSLALFALIAGAGLSVLDQVLRTQAQTEGRLERLAGLQRMMHLVTRDMSEAMPGTVVGDAGAITLGRSAEAGLVMVRYGLVDGQLTREVAPGRGDAVTQALLPDVAGLRWQYLDESGAWLDSWPGADEVELLGVAAVIALPGAGELRRVVAVPRAGGP